MDDSLSPLRNTFMGLYLSLRLRSALLVAFSYIDIWYRRRNVVYDGLAIQLWRATFLVYVRTIGAAWHLGFPNVDRLLKGFLGALWRLANGFISQ